MDPHGSKKWNFVPEYGLQRKTKKPNPAAGIIFCPALGSHFCSLFQECRIAGGEPVSVMKPQGARAMLASNLAVTRG
ncbi:MAG: hypothetical protein ACREVL_16345, partial [Solimonas sp.]